MPQASDSTAVAVGALSGALIGLLIAAIFGGLVGWLASIVTKANAQMGIAANVAVGVAGSIGGAWIYRLLGLPPSTPLGLVMAVTGAALLIVLLRTLKVLR